MNPEADAVFLGFQDSVAYVPNHIADVFISYCHDDDFVWIERFKQDLHTSLVRKLRARTKPEIFLDAHSLRAGKVFDAELPPYLAQTGFFVAMVSPRYNASTYCRQKELKAFLLVHPPEAGRFIQVQLDLPTALPVDKALAVAFADAKGIFRPDTEEYRDALRRVYEPSSRNWTSYMPVRKSSSLRGQATLNSK